MILVTGGTGLVGSHLLYKLISNNETVRAIYRKEKTLKQVEAVFSCYTDDYQALYNRIEWVKADLLDLPRLTLAFEGITHVYHCAAFVSFEPDKYQILRKTNIEGTANIVNLCLSLNVDKLCYTSSIATLGETLDNSPITEATHWNPEADNSVYGITKYGAEMEVWRAIQEGLHAVIVNPSVILGPGIWRYGTGNLFKKAYKHLKYYTSGTISLVAVNDVVSIMTQLMVSHISNERFILVAETWTYKDFLKCLSEAVNAKSPKKQASVFLLSIAWKLDWLRTKLTGKRRQLTRHLVQSLTSETTYNNAKITAALDYKFSDINNCIIETGRLFLKQV